MKYLIVRDGGVEHLLGLADSQSRAIASSASRLDLYAALVKDAGLSVVMLDAGGAVVTQKQKAAVADTEGGVCGFCHQQRIKDGVTARGVQRWRCPQPHNQRQEARGARATRRGKRAKRHGGRDFASNPKCPTCSKTMNITGRAKGVTYYKCKQGCPDRPRGEGWSSVNMPTAKDKQGADGGRELEAIVRARVSKLNGHSTQIRDDIVQDILLDLEMETVSLHDIQTSDDAVRRYIRKANSAEPNKYRDVPLDTPVGDGEMTVGETLVARQA